MAEDDPLNPIKLSRGVVASVRAMSPVNYEAWQDGYQPPGDHVLIHNLMYEGAHVVSSLALDGFGFWVVVRGTLAGKKGEVFRKMLESQIEDIVEHITVEPEGPPSSDGIERPDPNGEVSGSSPEADTTAAVV